MGDVDAKAAVLEVPVGEPLLLADVLALIKQVL